MGYYTYFTLNTTPKVITKLKELYPDTEDMMNLEGEFDQDYKWYDHHIELAEVSKYFPEEVIELHCEGEDTVQWMEYYKNGKQQVAEGKMVFAPYDETLLK